MKWASDRRRVWAVLLEGTLVVCAVWAGQLWLLQRSVEQQATYWSGPHGQAGGLLHFRPG